MFPNSNHISLQTETDTQRKIRETKSRNWERKVFWNGANHRKRNPQFLGFNIPLHTRHNRPVCCQSQCAPSAANVLAPLSRCIQHTTTKCQRVKETVYFTIRVTASFKSWGSPSDCRAFKNNSCHNARIGEKYCEHHDNLRLETRIVRKHNHSHNNITSVMRYETTQFFPKYPVLWTGRTGTRIRQTWAKRNCATLCNVSGIW
jgi:hypothetical protein